MSGSSRETDRTSEADQATGLRKEDIREAFELFDTDGVGYIDAKAVRMVMKSLGFEPMKGEIEAMIKSVASDDSGQITYEQFFDLMTSTGDLGDPDQKLHEAFEAFDLDHTGKISFDNLREYGQSLGEAMRERELREMIEEADRDKDGEISYEEFARVMKKIGAH
jgi:centrin-1